MNSGVAGKYLGNWQISAILTYNNSQPLGITQSGESFMNGTNYPNINPNVPMWSGNYNQVTSFFEGKVATAPYLFSTRSLYQHRQSVRTGQRKSQLQFGARPLVPCGKPERQEGIPYHRGNVVLFAHGLLQRVEPGAGAVPDHDAWFLKLRSGHEQVLGRQPPGTGASDL